MKKIMTLLLLSSVGISSLKAADNGEKGSITKQLLYAAGAIGLLTGGYYLKK